MDDIEVLVDEKAPLILQEEDSLSLDFRINHHSSYSTFREGKILYFIFFLLFKYVLYMYKGYFVVAGGCFLFNWNPQLRGGLYRYLH